MVSIVIPTLNEAESLPTTLDAIALAAGGEPYEVIVADGGSTDATPALAGERGCRFIRSPRAQRAAQMNAGAEAAHGSILLFLHADTWLPPGALESVSRVCNQQGVVGGGFARRYHSPSRWLRLTCWLARWRNRLFGWHLGDQAMFARRTVFQEIGGFRDFDVFEDVDFSRRLARRGLVRTLQPPVISSARRFVEGGIFRRSLGDGWLMWRYLLGASPRQLLGARAEPPSSATMPVVPPMQALRGDAKDIER